MLRYHGDGQKVFFLVAVTLLLWFAIAGGWVTIMAEQ
jgi:hypothetical protein